jgi:hypothetical protein
MSESTGDHPDPTGLLLDKHTPSGDCTTKTEQVVQDAKDAVEAGDLARAFHYIARFGDRGVRNYTTEELLHAEIDDVFGSVTCRLSTPDAESTEQDTPDLYTDGQKLADYTDVLRPGWALDDDGLEQMVTDASRYLDGQGRSVPGSWIAVEALVEVLQLDVEPESEREVRLVLATAESVLSRQ